MSISQKPQLNKTASVTERETGTLDLKQQGRHKRNKDNGTNIVVGGENLDWGREEDMDNINAKWKHWRDQHCRTRW